MDSDERVCRTTMSIYGQSVRGLRIENDLVAVTVFVDKGADIYELIYKPHETDVLWKSPWGLKDIERNLGGIPDSQTAWLEAYAGGWQMLFPNGGDACVYKGAQLGYHGEASMISWRYEVTEQSESAVEVCFSARLLRSPFRIWRWLRLEAGKPILALRERIINEAGEPMDYMWSHHPAFGAPFLSEVCHIDTGARRLLADADYTGTANPLAPGVHYEWPLALRREGMIDMGRVPGQDTPRDVFAYLHDFEAGWYAITNRQLGFGVGCAWPLEVFPYAWFWQEMCASSGFPFYKNSYVMAIEPASSIPGHGLMRALEQGTHRTLQPGEATEVELRVVFYDSTTGVEKIDLDGTVHLRKDENIL